MTRTLIGTSGESLPKSTFMRKLFKFPKMSPRTKSLVASNFEGVSGVILIAVFSRFDLMGTAPEWALQIGMIGMTVFSGPELLRWAKRRYPGTFVLNAMLVIDLAFLLMVGHMSSWGPWSLMAVALYTPKFFETAGPQVWRTACLFMIPAGALG